MNIHASQGDIVTIDLLESARRSARAILKGPEIFDFLYSAEGRAKLVVAAENGYPPVTAISDDLVRLCGNSKDAKLLPVRQFAGRCIKAVLQEEGFEIEESGVRLSKDPIFKSGAIYRRAVQATPVVISQPLDQMLRALTKTQAASIIEFLQTEVLNRSDAGTSQARLRGRSKR